MLNKEPKLKPGDVIIPFITGANGLQYLDEYLPEEDSVMTMVAQKGSEARVGRTSACNALCSGFDSCRRRPQGHRVTV